jgi:hypothetical protein
VSFRDDHEAALARVSALEDEAERLRRDNERLKAENAELRDPPKPPKPPKPPRTPSERALLIRKHGPRVAGVAGVIALFALVIGAPLYVNYKNEREYKVALVDYERQKSTWHALIQLEDCARDTLHQLEMKALDAAKQDPRTHSYRGPPSLNGCVQELAALASIPTILPAKDALDQWRIAYATVSGPHARLAEYYQKGDWKDDNYAAGPTLWADYLPALQAFHAATSAAFKKAAPLVRAEIRAIQRVYEDKRGKDSGWWRIEVGYARNELASLRPLGGTQEEVFAKAKELRKLIAAAPLELRRDWRQIVDELDWVDRGQKDPRDISDYQLWNKTKDEGVGPVPKRPVQAEGCGDGGAG